MTRRRKEASNGPQAPPENLLPPKTQGLLPSPRRTPTGLLAPPQQEPKGLLAPPRGDPPGPIAPASEEPRVLQAPAATSVAGALLGVTAEPVDRRALEAFLAVPEAGGRVVFEGVVRNHHDGRTVTHLEYEAYGAMAERQIAAIAATMQERWPVYRVVIVHRTGRLEIGEVAVVVGVAAAHRNEAFEACRFGIDQVKADVPIWKHEHCADGTASWQDNAC